MKKFIYQAKILKCYKYNENGDMLPAEKVQTLIDVECKANNPTEVHDFLRDNHQTFFLIGDTYDIKIICRNSWIRRLLRRLF